jgi:hypothetical protein
MVWCCCDPEVTLKQCLEIGNEWTADFEVEGQQRNGCSELYHVAHTIRPYYTECYYDRRYTQVFTYGRCFTGFFAVRDSAVHAYSYASRDITVNPTDMIVEQCWVTVCGFQLSQKTNQELRDYYAVNPMVIPSEYIRWYRFSTAPTSAGINCVISLAMNNVSEIILLFPRSGTDLTCFYNPMLRDINLSFMNRKFPERGGSQTNTYEFYRMQQEACNLDGWLQPTESYENSHLRPPFARAPYRDRSTSDNGSFMMVCRTERDTASPFGDDGLTTKQQETITLTASPIQTEGKTDTYYLLNRHDSLTQGAPEEKNTTPPIICLVSKAIWLLRYGQPPVFNSTDKWNTIFARHYPDVFKKMCADAGVAPEELLME